MMKLEEMLCSNPFVSDYKINIHAIKSYELFFVKGILETVRCTDTCDTEATVYVRHGEYLGDARFTVYPSTTPEHLASLIEEAVEKAKLIQNKAYSLPAGESGEYTVESNFAEISPEELAAAVANKTFLANTIEHGSLNSVEVFINKHTETVINSRGIRKTQVRYDAMLEAIPTYNGPEQSVELYEQYNFSNFDPDELYSEISDMLAAAKARYEAQKPPALRECKVILHKNELSELFSHIVRNLNYGTVYRHGNVFSKGDRIQSCPEGDRFCVTMSGETKGSVRSSRFDADGLALDEIRIITDGQAVAYFGDNQNGQYLGEKPTGNLRCINVSAGSAAESDFAEGPYLEVISMSGLQVDFFNDYIGGEVRLAYYHDGRTVIPVTGISISGSARQILNKLRLSKHLAVHNGYCGPDRAILTSMKAF